MKKNEFLKQAELWIAGEEKRIKKNTYLCYSDTIKRINKAFTLLDDEFEYQEILNSLLDIGYSKSTIHHARVVINAVIRFINSTPQKLYIPVMAKQSDVEALTEYELRAVTEACKNDFHGDLILFLLNTGLRRAELCNLKKADYSRKNQTIRVQDSKTANGKRLVPLNKMAQALIALQPANNSIYLFSQGNGKPITDSVLRRTYLRIRKISGVKKLTNHVCRHTFATQLISKRADPATVSDLLGHASVAFTMQRYVTPELGMLRKVVNLL